MSEISDALNSALNDLQKVLMGLKQGIATAIQSTPRLFQQELDAYVTQKLDLTADEFLNSVDVYWEGGAIVVEIDEDNWLANALETGVDGWDMKNTHLNSPKAKFSRSGFKYLTIPIEKFPSSRGGGTEKSQYYHKLVTNALDNNPKFSTPKFKIGLDGTIGSMEQLITNENDLGGFYRVRKFKEQGDTKTMNTQYIMFRTMSSHPKQAHKWIHPGIQGINSLEHLELWSRTQYAPIVERMIDYFIDNQVNF